ncbi:MAG TPA: Fic family protein [Micromonosporaceae bacterium]
MSGETYYPTLADVAAVARKIGAAVRDAGLIESAVARPRTTIFGEDAYPDLWTKAAALLHSLVNNRPFGDGNKRVGWIVAVAFLRQNGTVSSSQLANADQDAAYDLVIAVAESRLTEVDPIADALRKVF